MLRFKIGKVSFGIYRGECLAYVLAGLFALLLIAAIEKEKHDTLDKALTHYTEINRSALADVAVRLENNFQRIHQGLRTIARLPGVRAIDRYGVNFSDDARTSVQEIYNNLAESVAVSEVYIVPADFDPDALDPTTGKKQEPIAEFDQLIVGKTADSKLMATRGGVGAQSYADPAMKIEIHEYRMMKTQIAFFKIGYPHENKVLYEAYPAIAGREVLTCDATRWSAKKPNDHDRMGLVYSVPFFGLEGRMRGIISAVILTPAISDMIPGGTNALSIPAYSYVAGSSDTGIWQQHLSSIEEANPAKSLLYSSVNQLSVPDLGGDWKLWAGLPDVKFWNSTEVKAAHEKARLQELVIVTVLILLCVFMRLLFAKHRAVLQRASELEAHVEERTVELAHAKTEAEQANMAKSRFLANMSHDIRTPLSAITGMADLISKSKLNQKQTKHLGIIINAGRNLSHLISQILDVSMIEAGKIILKPQYTSLAVIVDEVISFFDEGVRAKGLELSSSFAPDLPDKVFVDATRLRQVLMNLVGNAIKFSDEGEINIDVRLGQRSGAGCLTIMLAVSDTGIGIKPDARADLFEPFRQAADQDALRYGGTGLGLSISKNLVTSMGGSLNFKSVPGKGTTFFFSIEVNRLPDQLKFVAESDSASEPDEINSVPDLTGANILLAEDNMGLRELMTEILEPLNCNLTVVENGRLAVKKCEAEAFDIILMDCRMPEMDGYEATRAIREREKAQGLKSAPIIALTANAFEEDRERCLSAGMTDFVSKPFTARQIINIIASRLRGDPNNDAAAGANDKNRVRSESARLAQL